MRPFEEQSEIVCVFCFYFHVLGHHIAYASHNNSFIVITVPIVACFCQEWHLAQMRDFLVMQLCMHVI